MRTILEALAIGRQSQQARDYPRAEGLFREVVQADPSHAEAWCLLAGVYQAQGRLADARDCYRGALEVWPDYVEAHNGLGIVLARQGETARAAGCFEEAVRLRPDYASAHSNLGSMLLNLGRHDEALACYQEAVRLRPDLADAHHNIGVLLRGHRQFAEAEAASREAVRLRPDFVEAYNNLGGALAGLGRIDEAIAAYRQALAIDPAGASAHASLGRLLADSRRLDEAEASLREAARLDPAQPRVWVSLANVLRELDRLDEALDCGREALRLAPADAGSYSTLGLILSDAGRYDEALEHYDRSLVIDPGQPEPHLHRALVRLLLGDLKRGWDEYEWRWRCQDLPPIESSRPAWDGSRLDGRTIVLFAEQGLGDTIQFVRYASMVKRLGGTVVLVVPEPLRRLLALAPGIDWLVVRGEPLPPHDVQAPLLSLPRLFGTDLRSIPAEVPYLFADPRLEARWRRQLDPIPGFKVGIAWRGASGHRKDARRSFPLRRLAPLAEVPGVLLVSLQKGPAADDLRLEAGGWPVIDLDRRLGDFNDTAAALKALDLVVCCDTAVGHLAGALGVPAWLALPFDPDWRWLLGRADSPWYPSVRLFRQARPGDWEGVFSAMAEALRGRLAASTLREPILAETTPGALLDRIAALEALAARITDPARLRNLQVECAALEAARDRTLRDPDLIGPLIVELKEVHEAIRQARDELQRSERIGDFGPRFVDVARTLAREGRRRAGLRRRIDERLGARFVEDPSDLLD